MILKKCFYWYCSILYLIEKKNYAREIMIIALTSRLLNSIQKINYVNNSVCISQY
jgi:hypothetical protein